MKFSHPGRRTVIATASVMSLAVGVTAALGVATSHREVLVEVDGVQRPVDGFFTTVDGVLAAAGVTVGEHDLVAPAVGESVSDGATVVVRHATRYDLTVDGERTSAWSTAASLEGVLDQVGGGSVVLAADRSSERPVLPIASGTLDVLVDGQTLPVEVAATDSVDDILARAGVQVSPIDRVAFVSEGAGVALRVTRVSRGTTTEEEIIERAIEEREDSSIPEGETEVIDEGADGRIVRSVWREQIDGRTTVESVVSEEMTEASPRIVAVGTGPARSTVSASSSSSGGSSSGAVASGDVWAALAACESGGNPATNTGNGYYGLYQFSLSTWRSLGGTGLPSEASAAEQTQRAQQLQARAGWGQWPACAARLGLY